MTAAPVRRARHADAPAITDCWSRLVAEHARIDPAFALEPGAEHALARAVDDALGAVDEALWVAERDGRFAGFCCARIARADAPAVERERAEITELYVCDDARRCGLGRALADAALAWARDRGAARVEVRVASGNAAGQAFWRALGFGAFVDVLDRRL